MRAEARPEEGPGQDQDGRRPQGPDQVGAPCSGFRPGFVSRLVGVPECLPEPGVELVLIGENRGFPLPALGPVDGHAVPFLPAVAGPDVAPQVGGDVLPGAEQIVLRKLVHGGVGLEIQYFRHFRGGVKGGG